MPDISEGERVSPPCAKITWPLVALALARSALPTAASRANPPRRCPSGISSLDVIDQNECDACGRVRRRAGKADAADWDKQKAGGKTAANEEHGGMLQPC